MTLRTCIECGDPCVGTHCDEHKPTPTTWAKKPTSTSRGYDTTWRRLSERARRLQRFCTDCGTTEDLTADHSPQAWERKAAGLPIRLQDIEVVCRSCNAKRGKARDLGGRGQGTPPRPKAPESISPLHTPGGIE